MESRFNIPAPAVVKLKSDICAEAGRRLKVTVPQGDAEVTAEADLLKHVSRKTLGCSHGCPYRNPTQVGE